MEWRKATKYIIIMLLAVNAVLFCLNLYKANSTVVSSGRIADISVLLKDRDITLNCSLPNKYRPMAQLNTHSYSFDYIKLQNLFMSGRTDITRTEKYSSVVFASGNDSLVINGSSIEYTGAADRELTSSEDAAAYAAEMANKINELFGSYELYSNEAVEGGYSIKYYSKYDSKNVFSNFLYFTIKGGNVNISLNYSEINGTAGRKEGIIGSDEALFAAADSIKADYSQKSIISDVELGYYDSELSAADENYAVPCYVIRVENREYFVNAYTGEVL